VLGAFTYTQNPALLHTDATVLPRRPAVRASWNYELSGCEPDRAAPRISYHMNRLQNLAGGEDYIVTLGGPVAPVDPGRVIEGWSTRIRPTRRPRSRRSAACPG
jgi:predicted NAD/FAD-binding protein